MCGVHVYMCICVYVCLCVYVCVHRLWRIWRVPLRGASILVYMTNLHSHLYLMFSQLHKRLGWEVLIPKISAKKMTRCVVLVGLFFQYAHEIDCTHILQIEEQVQGSLRSRRSTRFYTVYTVKTSVLNI